LNARARPLRRFARSQVKEWKKQIKKEIRGMEREINQLTQAEKKIQKEIQATAKKGYDARSARAARARARLDSRACGLEGMRAKP
jgi:predicted  nucleic acid-binding Zn-ribbon protein